MAISLKALASWGLLAEAGGGIIHPGHPGDGGYAWRPASLWQWNWTAEISVVRDDIAGLGSGFSCRDAPNREESRQIN